MNSKANGAHQEERWTCWNPLHKHATENTAKRCIKLARNARIQAARRVDNPKRLSISTPESEENFSILAHKEKLENYEVLALLRLRTWEGQPWEDAKVLGLGNNDIFVITKDGIRAEPVSEEELSRFTFPGEEQQAVLKAENDLRLDFSCTPAALVALVERNSDVFVLPDSFVEAVRLKSPKYRDASITTEKRECEEWLSRLIKAGPPQKNKEGYRQEAMTKFKRLSSRGFNDAWKNAIAQAGQDGKAWSNPGRKRKKKS